MGGSGIGEKYHPVPWSALHYSEDKRGYVVNLTKEQLASGPAGSIDELTENDGYAYRDRAYAHYKTRPYWSSERRT